MNNIQLRNKIKFLKSIERQKKARTMTKAKLCCGYIYKLVEISSGLVYYGSTRNLENREEGHMSPWNACMSRFFGDFNLYILEYYNNIKTDELLYRELWYITTYKNINCRKPIRIIKYMTPEKLRCYEWNLKNRKEKEKTLQNINYHLRCIKL